jgi:hypothetical protein
MLKWSTAQLMGCSEGKLAISSPTVIDTLIFPHQSIGGYHKVFLSFDTAEILIRALQKHLGA